MQSTNAETNSSLFGRELAMMMFSQIPAAKRKALAKKISQRQQASAVQNKSGAEE